MLPCADKATQRRPYARRPAHDEPTVGLRASSLGGQAAQRRRRRKSKLIRDSDLLLNLLAARGNRDPDPRAAENAPRTSRTPTADPLPWHLTGPDREPRERRTYRDAQEQAPVLSDWTSFDVQATLRSTSITTYAMGTKRCAGC